jgi:cysteine desulfurase/selenocysteine lyase
MTNKHSDEFPMPSLDDMLAPLLFLEEGEHEVGDETEDGARLRRHFFPVTRTGTYLNHAAQGPLPRPVVQTVREYLDDTSLYGVTHEARWMDYERGAHRRLAHMINARPDQIAFTASTGDGLSHIALSLDWQEGDEIVSAQGEFPSNVYPWLNLREHGVQVRFVPARDYRIPAADMLANISERTRLVSLSLVEFSTGYRNDVATIARYCRERGIVCGIDAMQALGAIDIDVQALGVDYLAAAAHKWLLAPRTTGILYVADDLLPRLHAPRRGWLSVETPFDFANYEQPLKQGAARFEYSSSNLVAIIGLDAALGVFEAIDGGMQAVEERALGLTEYAIAGLERLGYLVVSPRGAGERSSIVCFKPKPEQVATTAQQLVDALAAQRVHIAARGDVARISPHFYNAIEDIDRLLNVLESL